MDHPTIHKIKLLIDQYRDLSKTPLNDTDIDHFFTQWGDLKEDLSEIIAHIYIDYTCHTDNPEKSQLLQEATALQEEIAQISQEISKKLLGCEREIPSHLTYAFKLIKNALDLFNESNLPLETKENLLSQEYQSIIGNLTFEYEGKVLPIAQSKAFLEDQNREIRKTVFKKTQESFFAVKDKVNDIFNTQIALRDEQAKNAKFDNYAHYMHRLKDRFDYSQNECLEFSESILKHIVPLSSLLRKQRRETLKIPALEPFDLSVDLTGNPPLKPFANEQEVITKTLDILNAVNPAVAKTLKDIQAQNGLDLFSRQNKAPGGYNFPLGKSKTSFIFMNCTFTHSDLTTLIHETGHAYHFDCYKNQAFNFIYKNPPSEVAELASMSMELMSMEHWHLIYTPQDTKRAKLTQLEGIIHFFPWMAVVDSFQQWCYANPKASIQDRNDSFKTLYTRFFPEVSWQEFSQFLPTMWQKQPHIIEVPFYYIEYGIAQLGALQIWDQYKKDPQAAFKNYTHALSLGSKYAIKEIYKQAQIELNFTEPFIKSIADTLKQGILE